MGVKILVVRSGAERLELNRGEVMGNGRRGKRTWTVGLEGGD